MPRVLPPGRRAVIERGSWPVPAVFNLIQKIGAIEQAEMDSTFNNGLGLIFVVDKKHADACCGLETRRACLPDRRDSPRHARRAHSLIEDIHGRQVPIGVLISGGGTNLQAIIDAIEAKKLDAKIQVVLSNKADAYGLTRAKQHGIATAVLDHKSFASREDYDQAVVDVLRARGAELVILAGFMRLLSPVFIKAYSNRIMNIHPSLLPSFPGLHVQKKALDHGVRFAGCTVHFVNEECDEGPIIIQAVVPVYPDDDEATLAARILKQEHRIYPRAIQLYAEGRLHVTGRKVLVDGLTRDESPVLVLPPLEV